MTPADVLALLRLPPAAVVDVRVAKADLDARLAAPADRRLVREHLAALRLHAAVNPASTGLPAGDAAGLFVLVAAAKRPDPPPRLDAVLHAAAGLPALVVRTCDDAPATLTVRPAAAEVAAAVVPDDPPAELAALLAVDRADSLGDLRRRWGHAVLGLVARAATGRFPPRDPDPAAVAGLLALDRRIASLTAAARRERQARRRAELNLELRRLRHDRTAAADALHRHA